MAWLPVWRDSPHGQQCGIGAKVDGVLACEGVTGKVGKERVPVEREDRPGEGGEASNERRTFRMGRL